MLNTNLSRKSGLPFGLTYTQIAGAGLLLLCASPLPVQAVGATSIYSEIVQQTGKIKGTVVDESGEPIIGATVVVKGTTNGTVTDFDGNFEVDAKVGDLLDISYVGYKSQQVKATAQIGRAHV